MNFFKNVIFHLISTGEATQPPTTSTPPSPGLDPLWIAIICVCVPLLLFAVLVGAKKCTTRLWVPEGFDLSQLQQNANNVPRGQRSEPVGQEVSLR